MCSSPSIASIVSWQEPSGTFGAGNPGVSGVASFVVTHAPARLVIAYGARSGSRTTAMTVDPGADPQLAYLTTHYQQAFKTAFASAAAALDARDRNILRMHHLDGVTLEKLAGMYWVNRAIMVRCGAVAGRCAQTPAE